MAAACAAAPTGMTAVLGGDPDEVDAILARLGLVAANRNGAGQIVVAGSLAALAARREPAGQGPAAAARGRGRLPHLTRWSRRSSALSRGRGGLRFERPARALLSNADGAVVDGAEATLRDRLVTQVAAPGALGRQQRPMAELGVTALLELAPGGTLTGLAKRALAGSRPSP